MATTDYVIPLSNVPQTFQISLAGKGYVMTVKWNDSVDAGWVMDLSDVDTSVPVVAGIPLVTGVNLLDGLEYLGIGGQFYVYTAGDATAVPTLDNLGVESNLYFSTDVDNG